MSYWDCGEYRIRHGVLELIAGLALLKVDGVKGAGLRAGQGDERPKRKNITRGIKAHVEEGNITLFLQVYADFEAEFLSVAETVQQKVKEAVEGMTGLPVVAVDVEVVGVNAP